MGSSIWRMWTYCSITILPIFRIGRKEWAGFGKLKQWKWCFCFRWQHFCVLYNSSRQKIDIFGNGVLTFSKDTISALSGLSFHQDLLSLITIGKGSASSFSKYCPFYDLIGEAKGKFSQEFYGEFSSLYIWNRVLTGQEVDKNYQCGQASSNGRQTKLYLTSSVLDSGGGGGWVSHI